MDAVGVNVSLQREVEPNDNAERATAFTLPAVVEGNVGHPGDIDRFRFKAGAGQKLAFELQTPRAGLSALPTAPWTCSTPRGPWSSRICIHTKRSSAPKRPRPSSWANKSPGRWSGEGEYWLRVRDLTSVRGSSDHVYRVLVRLQSAHIGAIPVQPSGPVNLRPGAKVRLTLTPSVQEGFSGTLATSVDGLPAGVRAFASNNAVELVADANAPVTSMPQMLRVWGLPARGEKSGSAFLVAETPIMVVQK